MSENFYYEQRQYAKEYLIPHLQKHILNFNHIRVLEIGCAEAGLLEELNVLGIKTTGLELNANRVKIALKKNPKLDIRLGDITNSGISRTVPEKFDVIIMREVIEHLPDKETALKNISHLLKNDGYIFISFPPKYSPFAGHQQVGRTILKRIPYLHLFPNFILKFLEKLLKEHKGYADHLKLHYQTGMSIHLFEKYCSKFNFAVVKKDLFLFRPIYNLRFGLPMIKLPNIPFVREFLSLGYECILIHKN